MIKLVFCLRRLPTLSAPEFHGYSAQDHAELVRQHAPSTSDSPLHPEPHLLGSPPFPGDRGTRWSDRSVRWSSRAVVGQRRRLFEARSTAEGQIAGRALLSDERTFIDLPNSPLFFTNEHLIIST